MNSGLYQFDSDFKSLFSSESLDGNPEVILWRTYDAGVGITHHIGSYNKGTEGQPAAANLALVKTFICKDGKVWQNSAVADASSFSMEDLDRTSTRLNSSHYCASRMPSSA